MVPRSPPRRPVEGARAERPGAADGRRVPKAGMKPPATALENAGNIAVLCLAFAQLSLGC
jgi:hypothetical protein